MAAAENARPPARAHVKQAAAWQTSPVKTQTDKYAYRLNRRFF